MKDANPQLEDGFTKIANELMHALMSRYIPVNHMRCLLYIFRKVYGYKNKYYVRTSYGDIAKATGILRRNALSVMADLVKHKLLVGVSTDTNLNKVVVATDTNRALTYGINKHYNQWIPFEGGKRRGKVGVSTDTNLGVSTDTNTPIIKEKRKYIPKIDSLKFKKKVPIPDPFPIYDALKKYAKKKGFNGNLQDTHEAFLLYHKKNGSKYNDWYAAWQTWIRNAINPPWGKKETDELSFADQVKNQPQTEEDLL